MEEAAIVGYRAGMKKSEPVRFAFVYMAIKDLRFQILVSNLRFQISISNIKTLNHLKFQI